MSPRAAWRLERLAYGPVYDYAAGKVDWMAAGLPTVRSDTAERRAIDIVETPHVCRPEALLGDLRGAAGDIVVTSDEGIVLGLVRAQAVREAEYTTPAEKAMNPGPTTVRAHEPLDALLDRMTQRGVSQMIVTTPEGRLLGVVRANTSEP